MTHAGRVPALVFTTILLGAAGAAGDEPGDCSPLPLASAVSPTLGPHTLWVQGTARLLAGRIAAVPPEATIARGAIPKGKRNRVLLISATLTSLGAGYPPFTGTPVSAGGVTMWPAMVPAVNGLGFNGDIQSVDCGGSGLVPTPPYCVLTATWLADLDRLERAFPGKVIGKPLCIELAARDFAAAPVPLNLVGVTLSAVMLKK
jgi:hypothetical protein